MGCVPQKQSKSLDIPPTGDFTLYETGFNSFMYVTIKQPRQNTTADSKSQPDKNMKKLDE